ncbi:hypothetical protein [Polyangium aurulentum]|uniref:hypothetical protein n=1 Tax=Polyangium aurulentum TaxID=2567896 RepID=UPI0010AEDB45|nr:hypothetical protein [Polyangium aurulentum]UQA62823.1 hypothetical protein E8A73_021175 [Polyangium aurulentum]
MPKFAFIGACLLGCLLPSAASAIQEAQQEEAGNQPITTCAATTCAVGFDCVETRRGARCVAPEENANAPVTTCAATTCMTGTTCVDTPRGARCVGSAEEPGEDERASCLAVLCAAGTLCVETEEEGAVCLPIVQESRSSGVGQTGQTGQTDRVDAIGGTGPGANPTCAAALCEAGSRCVATARGAVCVPHPRM